MDDPSSSQPRSGIGGQLIGMVSAPRLVKAATRTGGFATASILRAVQVSRKYPEVPVPPPTLGRLASVFAEELMVLGMATVDDLARDREALARISRETDEALETFASHGWDADPIRYHRTPSAPEIFDVEERECRGLGIRQLSFDSGFEPAPELPGGKNWLSHPNNRRCYANVLEHADGPRPWLVLLHGFAMGTPIDLRVMRAASYHNSLGFNVLAVILPLHGPRRTNQREIGGTGLVSLDWMANVHGLTQAVWDVRRCLAWIRERGATSIAIHGMSLGGYTAALVAGLEADLACVVAGVPSATIHTPLVGAYRRNPRLRRTLDSFDLLGDRAARIHRVVTPTAFTCQIGRERRFIYAGTADRLATPNQPYLLWDHWDRPSICWTQRSHMFTMMSADVRRFVRNAVVSTANAPEGVPELTATAMAT